MSGRFDKEAADWDNNPDINRINELISTSVLPNILAKRDTVVELGCGTGLLTFRSFHRASEWLALDMSGGMIDMLRSKIPHHDGAKEIVSANKMFLERPGQLDRKYDWAVSSMTFHHIPDMQSTITCLAGCVKKGLVIVDFEAWDGSRVFHPEEKMEGVERHGLDTMEMIRMCRAAGFREVETRIGFKLTLIREGKEVVFPFLVVVARHL